MTATATGLGINYDQYIPLIRRVQQPDALPNLLLTLLKIPPPPGVGFLNYDFPNPRGYPFPIDGRTQIGQPQSGQDIIVIPGYGTWIQRGVHAKTWNNLQLADVGSPLNAPGLPDKTVTVRGYFGSGGSISITGSDDGMLWDILHDNNGNVLTFTANGSKVIAENPLFIRPDRIAGDQTTALSVVIVSKG